MTAVAIIQVGTAPQDIRAGNGDIAEWFTHVLQGTAQSVEVIQAHLGQALPYPTPDRVAIITGSWSMVTDRHPWSETLAEWIRQAMAVSMPLFGVCYGHQLMAYALGGRVDYHPLGCEIGCKPITLTQAGAHDPFVGDWSPRFFAHLTHLQTITHLPPGACALACSDHDPHQIVRYGPHAISVQFHPEFTPSLAAACIRRRWATLESQGLDPESLLAALQETTDAKRLITSFVQRSAQPLPNLMEIEDASA